MKPIAFYHLPFKARGVATEKEPKTMVPTDSYLEVNCSSCLSIKRTLMCTRLSCLLCFVADLRVPKSSIDESLSLDTLTEGMEGNLSFFISGRRRASERYGLCLGERERQCGREEENLEFKPASETTGQEVERLVWYADSDRSRKWCWRGAEEEIRWR